LAQNVHVSIEINGSKISPINSVSIIQRIDWHHHFEIQVPVNVHKHDHQTIMDRCKDYIGNKVSINFETEALKKKMPSNLFEGLITDVSLHRQSNGDKSIVIKGKSPTILADTLPNTRSYTAKTLKDMVNSSLEDISHSQLKAEIDPQFTKQIPYYVQYKESNFQFIQRIAEEFGEWCYYNGTELVFGKIPKDHEVDLPLDNELVDFDFSLKLAPYQDKYISYNYMENKVYESFASNFVINDMDSYGDFAMDKSKQVFKQKTVNYSYFNPENAEELNDIVERDKYSSSKNHVRVNGVSDNPYINVGSIVNVTDKGRNNEDFGKFLIISINHQTNGIGSYQNSFEAVPHDTSSPLHNKNVVFPTGDIQAAIVMDNDDPDKLGRVKVQHFWQQGKETSPWVRIIHAHGGRMNNEVHGFYFIPEIDDEVLVGFENENPNKPFVVGSVYHKDSSPGDWVGKDNSVKAIRTKQGNQILFSDEKGKEEIRILNSDPKDATNEITLTLKDNGKISIKTKGDS